MSDDESSFVILGSTPTPSMELYNGHEQDQSLTKENTSITSNVMQSSGETLTTFSLMNLLSMDSPSLSAPTDNLNGDSPVNSPVNSMTEHTSGNQLLRSLIGMKMSSTATGTDFAEKFLMGEIKADLVKYNIWKHFPSFCSAQSSAEDIEKLESLLNAHVKLKENLQKTNEAMRQHFGTIYKWQNKVRVLKETQADEISDLNAVIRDLREELRLKVAENKNLHVALLERDELNKQQKLEMVRIMGEHEEKILQFTMNLAYASSENKDLVQDISAKKAVIENMTNVIENLEEKLESFEMVSDDEDDEDDEDDDNSSMNKPHSDSDLALQLSAAREQNIQLLEDVSNKIVTIKQLESESSKLQHQLLSLEMIVNENGKYDNENKETVLKLKRELNEMSMENTIARDKADKRYGEEIETLKVLLEMKRMENDSLYAKQHEDYLQSRVMEALQEQLKEQQAEMEELQRANVLFRSREINSDIKSHQRDQEYTEMKEVNEFLKAQLDVYKSDFEMERQSRQDIANEREELLSDLKLLQRRNQQLIEEAQSRTRQSSGASSSSTPSAPVQRPEPVGRFICPMCNNASPSLMALQNHVQSCLEN